MSFTLDLSNIAAHGPCDASYFTKKSGGSAAISYPNGWTSKDVERVAGDNPVALLWLVSKRLVPTTFSEANAALNKVHGKDAADKVRAAFAAGPNARP
jgi:hypothetical protein